MGAITVPFFGNLRLMLKLQRLWKIYGHLDYQFLKACQEHQEPQTRAVLPRTRPHWGDICDDEVDETEVGKPSSSFWVG